MSKKVPDDIIDLLLAGVATATLMSVTSDVSTPVNLDNMLADQVMIAGDGNGDYTIGAGDVSGRKVTMSEKLAVPIDGLAGTNTANHVVLSLAGVFKDVTTCTAQALTFGGTVDLPAWDHEVLQAA